ncbi:MAG: hypothetical protein JSS24_03635 [Proteobacteria bacterium]|nr:hypothetical protein [Pseudomonadota bacterium]
MAGQFALYALFAGAIALLSRWPIYHQLGDDQALIMLSIVHEGQRLKLCAQRTPEELARLPPNMRAPLDCPRERAPLAVEVELDGRLAAHQVAQPSGLSRDGRASLYQRLVTTAGNHRITVRLRDRARAQGFDYQREATVQLRPAQVLVIDFEPTSKEITFR